MSLLAEPDSLLEFLQTLKNQTVNHTRIYVQTSGLTCENFTGQASSSCVHAKLYSIV